MTDALMNRIKSQLVRHEGLKAEAIALHGRKADHGFQLPVIL
ncbi:MAG: hypothetical protein RBR90_09205 [Candidatus Cloacimonadaceae bacterium]|nr:hypothetical protein [Candidatus Cloacimonadaceae bacterium]